MGDARAACSAGKHARARAKFIALPVVSRSTVVIDGYWYDGLASELSTSSLESGVEPLLGGTD